MNPILKAGLIAAACALSTLTHAGPITYNGYTLDEAENIVSGGGLEWLQWDETIGLSADEVSTDPVYAGWRLANNNEMASLFNAFTLGGSSWDTDPTTTQLQQTDWDMTEDTSFNNFMSLFSFTIDTDTSITQYGTITSTYSQTDRLKGAGAWYGNGVGPRSCFSGWVACTLVGRAIVVDDRTRLTADSSGTPLGQISAVARLERVEPSGPHRADVYPSDYTARYYGVALVRTLSVPEPSSLAIFVLGLMGLSLRHFRKKSASSPL